VVRNRLSEKQSTFAAFIDMRKAFDWVDRDMLLYKLMAQFGVKGRMYDAIKTIYSRSVASVRVNQYTTDAFPTYYGVKQGDVLSPTLFNMYLNDLAVGIKELHCGLQIHEMELSILLYADDIVLVAPNEIKLQEMLNYVSDWCAKWKMSVNTEKTQIVHFRPRNTPQSSYNFLYEGNNLEVVKQYKYLGILLNENMDFQTVAKSLTAAGSRAMGLLRYKLKSLKECQYNTFSKLYMSYICPILDYSAGVWGFKDFSVTETTQHRAIRYYLGVHRFAANDMINGDMGWLSCRGRRQLSMLNLWNRLINMAPSRLTYKVFLWDLSYCDISNTWANEIQLILQELSLVDVFELKVECDMQLAYNNMLEFEQLRWQVHRTTMDKLRYYNLFKADYSPEPYLLSNISKRQRSLLAQFRAGILPLEIETGRFKNIPLNQRICKICSLNEVEDELHFLLFCPAYSNARDNMLRKSCLQSLEICQQDFLDMFVHLNTNCQEEVAEYIEGAIKIRNMMLYR